MARLPQVSGIETVKALRKVGFSFIGQTGSHMKLRRRLESETQMVIVPNHHTIRKGTLRNIIRTARLSVDEFLQLL